MCEGLTLFADRPDHIKFLRQHVSRQSAGKGRAVLEGVSLDSEIIDACYRNNPFNEEEAVQEGLTKWCRGQGTQPPTWSVLIEAMEYAEIAQQYIHYVQQIQDLKEGLTLLGMLLIYYYAVLFFCFCVL